MIEILMAATMAAATPTIEIRACPPAGFYTHPLDTAHGLNSVLVQNIAVVNRGAAPIMLNDIELVLADGDRKLDRRLIDAASIAALAAGGKQLEAAGMFKLYGFQFCDGALLKDSKLAGSGELKPGEALLVMQQPFAFKGKRDRVDVTAAGATVSIPIRADKGAPLKWPLRTGQGWYVANGASFHTAHRWALPEEFGLDILAVDRSGQTHPDPKSPISKYFAYGADVLAAGDGTVAAVSDGRPDSPLMVRALGESYESYIGKVAATQDERFASGLGGIMGNHVAIDHGDGRFSHYAHLAPGKAMVKVGDKVKAGQVIGKLGSSGNSTEPHLHFQLCDGPHALSCHGIPVAFDNVDVPLADGVRPLQSGDFVVVGE